MSVDESGNSEAQYQAAALYGPKVNEPFVLSLTGAVQEINLLTAFKNLKRQFTLATDASAAHFAFAPATGASIDPAATGQTGGTCGLLQAAVPIRMYPRGDFLVVKGAGGDKLRVWPSSPG